MHRELPCRDDAARNFRSVDDPKGQRKRAPNRSEIQREMRRHVPLLETFAEHLASDAKRLTEDEETGSKSYRYIRTGTNHYSLAFTYDWLASEQERRSCGECFIDVFDEDDDSMRPIMWPYIRAMRNEGIEWPPRWDRDF